MIKDNKFNKSYNKGYENKQHVQNHTFHPKNVYLIYSRRSLEELDKFISNYGKVGYLRVIYDNKGNPTNRTIAVMSDITFHNLCVAGYLYSNHRNGEEGVDFKITYFIVNANNYPYEGHTNSLYIPVPNINHSYDYKKVYETINTKLEYLAEWDILPANSWNISLTLDYESINNEHILPIKGCYISFNNVNINSIVTARILLNDTYWYSKVDNEYIPDIQHLFRCYWAKKPRSYVKYGH